MNHGLLGFPVGGSLVVPTAAKRWWTYIHFAVAVPNVPTRVQGVAYLNDTGDDLHLNIGTYGTPADNSQFQVARTPFDFLALYNTPFVSQESMSQGLLYISAGAIYSTRAGIVPPGWWYRLQPNSVGTVAQYWNEYRSAP